MNVRAKPIVTVFRREDGLWDWHLQAANGEIVCGSLQGYESREKAVYGWTRSQDAMDRVTEVRYR